MSALRDHRPSAAASRQRRWRDLSGRERTVVVTFGLVELVLTATAAADLYRRSPASVRGPKAAWWPAIFVQPVGPLAYLAFGRRR